MQRHRFEVDVSEVAPAGVEKIAAEVILRADPNAARRTVLTCLPGGGMSRRYFDLQADGDGDAYSMAAHLATRGIIVVLLDHPAVGDSDVPVDPYVLTPSVVASIDAYATRSVLAGLRDGSLLPGVETGDLVPVGCGHSMGGMLTVGLQALERVHDAIAVLGFAGGGLIEHLSDEERAYAHAPDRLAADAPELTRARFGRPLSRGGTGPSPFLLGVDVPQPAIDAIASAGANLLNVCGLTSMIPGSSKPLLDVIDVPVFIGVGQFDITGPSHAIPAQFPASPDVTLFVCPQMGHNHNVAPTRAVLWDRLLVWLRQIEAQGRGTHATPR